MKTQWVNGEFLTPSFMNTQFGTDANTGHQHTGLNSDGSLPKVNLTDASEVKGLLPLANLACTSGTFDMTVTSSYFTAQVVFPVTYSHINNITTLFLPKVYGLCQAGNHELQAVCPDMPAEVEPKRDASHSMSQSLPCLIYDNTGVVTEDWYAPGAVIINPTTNRIYFFEGLTRESDSSALPLLANRTIRILDTHFNHDDDATRMIGWPCQSFTYTSEVSP